MKRFLLVIIFSLLVNTTLMMPSQAGSFADRKAQAEQTKIEKNYKKEILALFDKQDMYAKKYDIKGLKSLYSKNFMDNDGYNKEVYFSLVEETWETYPDITYGTKIKNITVNGDYAMVETEESAVATTDDIDRAIVGELHSKSNCRYHLQRFSNKWEITSEEVLDEISTLKYGNARYLDIKLEAPKIIGAGQDYTATLKVNLSPDDFAIASINQEKIVNPAQKPKESFKRLSDDNSLARIFTANTDNLNEYNVAALGITTTSKRPDGKVHIYMSGLAFVMTRVNVIPKNNFARVEEKTKEKTDEQ